MSGRKQFDPEVATAAAMRTFWESGYSAVSVADLQQAMGIGRASLYATFGGKEALFLRALEAYVTTYGPPVREAFANHADDSIAAIAAILDAALQRMSDPGLPPGCLVAQSAADLGGLEPASHAAVSELIAGQVASIKQALDNDEAAGRIRPGTDTSTLAVYVVGNIHSLSIMHRTGTPTATIAAVNRQVMFNLTFTCGGLSAEAERLPKTLGAGRQRR